MTQDLSNSSRWLIGIIGIIAIILGIMVLGQPIESYVALSLFFSIAIMFIGISEIITAISLRQLHNWGWRLASGILDCIIGFLLFANLGWTEEALPIIIGFILMYWGISFIMDSFIWEGTNAWLLICGILTLLCSFMIIFHPIFGIFDIIIWTAFAFIAGGISLILRAFSYKNK